MRILKKNASITGVRLRSHDELCNMYNLKLTPVDDGDYYLLGPETGNFSWNPNLKSLEVALMFAPYEKSNLVSICEGGLDRAFCDIGMTTATTSKREGYIRHIGWGYHVK